MKHFLKLLLGVAAMPASLFAQGNDSIPSMQGCELEEVVVTAKRSAWQQKDDRLIYIPKHDSFAEGMSGLEVLDRMPRVAVTNDVVSVAGKAGVRYIVDGRLLEMTDEAILLKLKNLQASGIEKIELLTSAPTKYAAEPNAAYISITTRNETLGSRGNIWGAGTMRESFSYSWGGNLSHTTRRIELSADLSMQDTHGLNDLRRYYSFEDYVLTSNRRNQFRNLLIAVNGLLKYKFSKRLSAGLIVNANSGRLHSDMTDITENCEGMFSSLTRSPGKPNNAMTLTAFSDWMLDERGSLLSFTYNYFTRKMHSYSEVSTDGPDNRFSLTDDGRNHYRIHSAKVDATIPFSIWKMEAGLAYTGISNQTSMLNSGFDNDISKSEERAEFAYTEHTAAAYASVATNFSPALFAKIGLRYEYTFRNGTTDRHYGYLFPSLSVSWSNSLSADYHCPTRRA